MDAAVQRKENDKTTKSAVKQAPEPQRNEEAETGAAAGVPLFLQSVQTTSAAAPPPVSQTSTHIQRQAEEGEEEEELIQPKCCGEATPGQSADEEEEPLQPKLVQRQPLEEEEELLQPKRTDADIQRQPIEEEEELLMPTLVQRQSLEEEEELLQPKHNETQVQRQAEEEEQEEEELLQPKWLQRQPLEEEEEEELLQPTSLNTASVQAKVTVGPPDDEYEREADQVADKAMRMPASQDNSTARKQQHASPYTAHVQTKPLTPLYIQRLCTECEDELTQGNATPMSSASVQPKSKGETSSASSNTLARTVESPGTGQPLNPQLQSRIGAVLGNDLSHVRVHSDSQAQQAAGSINAKAFTNRNHIFLGKGQSDSDVPLMAHEATHVVQQGASSSLQRSLVQREGPDQPEQVGEPGENQASNDEQALPQQELQQAAQAGAPAQAVESQPEQQQAQTQAELPSVTDTAGLPDEAAAPTEQQPQQIPRVGQAETAQGENTQADAEAPQQPNVDTAQQAAAEESQGGAGGTPAAEAGTAEAGTAEAGTAEAGTAEAGGVGAEIQVDASSSMASIAAAPDSIYKTHVQTQAELINTDSLASEGLITEMGIERRREVSDQFEAVRAAMAGFIEDKITSAQAFMAAKQTQVIAAAAGAITSAQQAVSGALEAVETQVTRIGETISGVVQSASSTIQTRITGIVSSINNVINSIPLPDLPGVDRARRLATNLLSRAAGAVNSALSTVLGALSKALTVGTNLVASLLGRFRLLIGTVMAQITAAITSIMQKVFQILNRLMNLIVSTLRRVLTSVILPTLRKVERRVLKSIRELEQQSLRSIQENRDRHLQALAMSLSPAANNKTADDEETTTDSGDWFAAMAEITQQAISYNRKIVSSFREKTGSFFALLVTTLRSVINQIIVAITSRIVQAISSILSFVANAVQTINRMVRAVISFIRNMISLIFSLFQRVVSFIRSLVERPIQRLIEFAKNVLGRIKNAISRFVRRVISGAGFDFNLREVIGEFRLPPTSNNPTIAFVPPPFLVVIIDGVVYIFILGLAITLTVTQVIVIIVVVILILLLLYLLYRWLTRPRPVPRPRPRPKPKGREFHPDTPFNVINSLPAKKVDLPATRGDELVFGVESTDKDKFRKIGTAAWIPIDPGIGPYVTAYQVSGHASWLAPGSGNTTHSDPTLNSHDISLFINEDWNGEPITVTATVRDNALPAVPPDIGTTQDSDHVITWTIDLCEDPLTTKTAKNIESISPNLNQTTYNSTTLTLLDGSSDTVGDNMITEFLTHEKTGGGEPSGQDNLYRFRKLPTKSAHGGSGFTLSQVYIKGHLLNHSDSDGLGGIGDPVNLYPITGRANKDHELGPEKDVKQLVHKDKVVTMYSVDVVGEDGPHPIDVFGDGACTYQFINAAFACSIGTYKYCKGALELKPEPSAPVISNFDVSGFISNVQSKGGCQES